MNELTHEFEEFIPYAPLTKKEKRQDLFEQAVSTFFVGFLALGMGGCIGFIVYEFGSKF